MIFLPKVGAGATVAANVGALLEFGSNLMKKAFSELSLLFPFQNSFRKLGKREREIEIVSSRQLRAGH